MGECPSTEWSARPDRRRAHVIRLQPGRWPKLLALIRSGSPPHGAGPYQRSAELLSLGKCARGQTEADGGGKENNTERP